MAFTKDSDSKAQHLLGLVTEPDGKRNWWIVDQVRARQPMYGRRC